MPQSKGEVSISGEYKSTAIFWFTRRKGKRNVLGIGQGNTNTITNIQDGKKRYTSAH